MNNAYLLSTTFRETSANLLGASTPSEWGNGGALALVAIAAVLAFLGIAARIMERRAKARRIGPRVGRRNARRQAEARRLAACRVAFGAIVVSAVASAAFMASPDASQDDGNADSTGAEKTQEDAEVAWNEANVKIRKVADSEGLRWNDASAFQDLESEWGGNAAEEPSTDDNKNDAANGDAQKREYLACRAEDVVESQESSVELKNVEKICARSSLEVAPASSLNSGKANDSRAETNGRVSAENVAWRNNRVDAWGQAAAQSGQTSRFAQSSQNLPPTQGLATAQSGRVSQPAQSLTTAQSGQVSQPAQSLATAQSGQVAQSAQNLATAQSGQVSQPAQNLATARLRQETASPATGDERRDWSRQSELTQAFTPSEPLIPFPKEGRGSTISSVSYEARAAEEEKPLLERIDAESLRIGERVRKSVLAIETVKRSKTKSAKTAVETGSGFLLQYKDKIYLATNMHVVKDAATNRSVKIFLPDRTTIHPTRIMTCADFDLAALELDPATLPSDGSVALCYFGDSDELRVSNFVGTIGNPFGLRDTVTYGHVSSLQRRKNDFTAEGDQSLMEFIQIDASINPGNSGGPLYNARGEVVGVVAAIATTTGKSEGVAFAIPINLALSVLKSTIDAGGWSRSRMGVELETATRADFQGVVERSIKSGAKLVGVDANSPAERAGLRRGDVVVEFNGEAIEDDVQFARLIAIADVSRDANVKFLRGAQLLETSARLERAEVK